MKTVSHSVEKTFSSKSKSKSINTCTTDAISESFVSYTNENNTTLMLEANVYEQTTVDNDDSVKMSLYLNETDNCIENVTPLCTKNSMTNLGLRGKGMHVGHLNVRGIRSKIDEVKIMLQSDQNNIAILGLSESKIGSNQPDSAFQIPGFRLFRKDNKEGSGGLISYVREDVTCLQRTNFESSNIENLWLEIFPKNSKSFLIGFIYRNPNSNVSWNDDFDLHIEGVLDEQKEVILLGDFNKDLLNGNINTKWTEYMTSLGFSQHINEPTRVVEGKSSTIIDHIYSNFPSNITFIDVPRIGLSDHFPVFLTRKIRHNESKHSHHTISYRSFKHFNEEDFTKDLEQVPWDVIKVFDDVDDAIDSWYSLLNVVIDKHLPIKEHRVKRQTQPKWLTPEIIDAIKDRDKLKSQGKEDEYKTARNNVCKLIRLAKQNNYETILEQSGNNPQNVWKVFKEFGAGKGGNTNKSTIFSIRHEDEQINDSKEIANIFNDFFISISSNLKEPLDPTSHENLFDFCKEKFATTENNWFEIPLVHHDKVLKYLSTLDTSKATGNDCIGPKLLRIAAPYIAESITYLCNVSIQTCTFPGKWKEAKVKPLHKTGSYEDVNNYRPISILPIISKLIEKHVHDSLMNFLESHSLICMNQSGFRPNHSCESALINIVEKWLKALNEGELVGVMLVDFRKAFDLVDHNILLNKLKAYQLCNSTINWFKSYLTDRKQMVQVANQLSDYRSVTCGVPQGSILGPLLFLLFINDLPLCTDNVITDMYADDTTLYDINKSQQVIERNLSEALNRLSIWCRKNGMVINFDKTKSMLITTRQKRDQLEVKSLNVKIDSDKTLKTVSCDKILGVQIDENLTWAEHIKSVTLKMSRNIWLLSQIRRYLSIDHRIIFYKSYIQPHIDYCNIVWSSCSQTCLAKIERLQKRACKVIVDYEYDDIKQSMNDLHIMTIYERIFIRKAKFMYKVSKNACPAYINELFRRRNIEDETVPCLRSTTLNNYLLPQPKSEMYRKSLAFVGPTIWNCLPQYIKMSSSKEVFHKSCIHWMKNGSNN